MKNGLVTTHEVRIPWSNKKVSKVTIDPENERNLNVFHGKHLGSNTLDGVLH